MDCHVSCYFAMLAVSFDWLDCGQQEDEALSVFKYKLTCLAIGITSKSYLKWEKSTKLKVNQEGVRRESGYFHKFNNLMYRINRAIVNP